MAPELSIIFPCRNEEKALAKCLSKAKDVIKKHKIDAQIIVSDSSSDRSPQIAREFGVVLVKHDKEGYGNAYIEGIKAAKGRFVLMVDADCTYDLEDIPRFLESLRKGNDLVIGDRFFGGIQKKAMPWSHRYIGNPALSGLLRFLFKSRVRDVHCGIRGIKRSSLEKLDLHTTGMEFASEMIIKATKKNLKIAQFPVKYFRRIGDSKLRSTGDGWRHLRFILLFSPSFLFLLPGVILLFLGLLIMFSLYFFNVNLFGITFYMHPMFVASSLIMIGYQLIFFSAFAKSYIINYLGEKEDRILKKLHQRINLESGLIFALILSFAGFLVYLFILIKWLSTDFGGIEEIKNSVIALTLVVLGVQTFFNSFMLSILGIRQK